MESDLSHVLLQRTDEVVASWAHRFDRSALRVPRPVDPRQHAAMVASMVVALGEAVQAPSGPVGDGVPVRRTGTMAPQRLRPGGPEVRELEQAAALAGASLSATGASGYDVAALVLAVRDAVLEFAPSDWAPAIGDVFEWLVVIALDGFASAGRSSAQERAAEALEEGTPVILVTQEVPAVLLVGEPSGSGLDSILARALLVIVRVGAPTLVLDVAGLTDPISRTVLDAVGRFFDQTRLATVEIALTGANARAAEAWIMAGKARGVTVTPAERFEGGVARAMERAGVQLVRRRT